METQAAPAPTLISIREAAELASVSRTHIWRLVRSAQVDAVRVGEHGPIRIPREPFLHWLYGAQERKEN
jgi:excisionase family DNA binding protein